MNAEVARIGVEFLKRVSLKGKEVEAYTQIWNALNEIINPVEAATVEARLVVALKQIDILRTAMSSRDDPEEL